MKPPMDYRVNPTLKNCIAHPIMKSIEWIDVAGPRLEYWVGPREYTYGTGPGQRTYDSRESLPFGDALLKMLNMDTPGLDYNCYFINGYRDHTDSLGWHSDDSPEMDPEHPIAIFTVGAEREIHFRRKGVKGPAEHKVVLESGSFLIMNPPMQAEWDHKIPKHSAPCGPRVSFTFRRLI